MRPGGDQRPGGAQARRFSCALHPFGCAGALEWAGRPRRGGRRLTIVAQQRTRAADLARYYDLDLLTDPGDLALYLRLAGQSHGPILELAAGTGRLAVPLAAAGHDVTGVDNDAAMLDRARARWESSGAAGRGGALTLLEHDLTTLELEQRFALIFVALNSLLLLEGRATQERALSVMRAHLTPTGRAVIDVWLPASEDLAVYDGRQLLEWVRTDHETDERVAKTTAARYDPASHSATITSAFDAEGEAARRTVREDVITFIGKDELLDAAADAGLEPVIVGGDYNLNAWSEASERVVLVCRSKAA